MNHFGAVVRRVAVVATLTLSFAGPLTGRAQSPGGHASVTIAVVDTFRYQNADAVIVRRASGVPHDVIVVRRDKLRPSLLSEAVVVLRAVRKRAGDIPSADMLIRVPTPKQTHRFQHAAGEWSRTLALTPRTRLDGLGTASVLTVEIP